MAQNITLWGASYSSVPSVTLPKTGGGTASFTDVTDTTAAASDVASGKYFYTSAGVLTQGTASGGGGGSIETDVAWADELSVAGSTLTFPDLMGEPTSFFIVVDDDLATGAQPWKIASVVYDGTSFHGQVVTNTSNANASYLSSGFSMSYSNNTLTVTSSGAYFQPTAYFMWYSYGGSSANVGTQDVQVGSGATSITFTDLPEEPIMWSCIFKSDFGTSSGYQRVMAVGHSDFGTSGVAMDSSAHAMGVWAYTYNNGSLTITSQGTNNGGYFHQPGYYQLTYAITGEAKNYQQKTVTPTTSQQIVTADVGYDALSQVTVNSIPNEYVIPSGNLPITSNGNNIDVANYATVSVNVSGGGGSSDVAMGTLTVSSNVNTSTNTKITDTSTIGFTPTKFFFWKSERTATSNHVHQASFITIGSSYYVRTMTRYSNNALSTSGNTNNWTTQSSGYLYFNSDTIYFRSSSSYILPSGTWYWVAIK